MNKKVNTALFILGATIFNIVTILIIFMGLLALLQWLVMPLFRGNNDLLGTLVIVAFLLAMAGNFFLYRFAIRFLDKKIHLEQYLEPIFFRKKH